MSEKPDSDEFEDEEADEVAGDEESLDVDRLMQDLDKRKRGAARAADAGASHPARLMSLMCEWPPGCLLSPWCLALPGPPPVTA